MQDLLAPPGSDAGSTSLRYRTGRWRRSVPELGGGDAPCAEEGGKHLPELDMPLDHWIVMPIMRVLPAGTRARIEAAGDITDVTRPLEPGGVVPGLPEWEWIAAPGHTPGSVAYLRRRDGVLITGDAVVTVDLDSVAGVLRGRTRLAGPPWFTTWQQQTARRSIAALAALEPRVLAPGHGHPLAVRTTEALHALAGDEGAPSGQERPAVDHQERPGDPGGGG